VASEGSTTDVPSIGWGPAGPQNDAGPGTDFEAVSEDSVSVTPVADNLTPFRLPVWQELLEGMGWLTFRLAGNRQNIRAQRGIVSWTTLRDQGIRLAVLGSHFARCAAPHLCG